MKSSHDLPCATAHCLLLLLLLLLLQ